MDQHKNDVNDLTDYDQSQLSMFGPQAVESFKDFEFGPEKYKQLEVSFCFLMFRSSYLVNSYF